MPRTKSARAARRGRVDRKRQALENLSERVGPELSRALRRFARLSLARRLEIVREIVETREAELRLAYSDLLDVAYGFRTIRRRGIPRPVREPCVRFVVQKKWTRREARLHASSSRTLPDCLLAYSTDRRSGERVLYAAPTDIEEACRMDAKPQSGTDVGKGIRAESGQRSSTGVVACAVRKPGRVTPFAMGCHHVFAMSGHSTVPGQPFPGANVRLRVGSPAVIGRTDMSWIGALKDPSQGFSLDVSLASVDSAEAVQALSRSLGSLRATSILRVGEALPLFAKALTARGEIRLDYVTTHPNFDRIAYFQGPRQPKQANVVQWVASAGELAPIEGDSGAPVVNLSGTQLLGMHIAGIEDLRIAYMLPAYFLFVGQNYGHQGRLELVSL